jgi:hypothetical protein
MKVYATRLIDFTEQHAAEIAKQWFAAVKKNPRTPSYHDLSEADAIPQAIDFYRNFRNVFLARDPYDTARQVFSIYAVRTHEKGIPLSEAIYALTLMRRHMWLYADFEAIFTSSIERQVAVESLNRTILMFDYAINVITKKYEALMRAEFDAKVTPLKAMGMEAVDSTARILLMAVLLLTAGLLTYYSQAVLVKDVIFTHLFYIPIVLACLWWKRKGILVALALGIYLVISHLIFIKEFPIIPDITRAVMFLVVSAVVAMLAEGLTAGRNHYGRETAAGH